MTLEDTRKPFLPGEEVEFCGERATVIKDYGHCGLVEMEGEGRMTWYWDFQGEKVRRVSKLFPNNEMLEKSTTKTDK